jgi:hypothetical protein
MYRFARCIPVLLLPAALAACASAPAASSSPSSAPATSASATASPDAAAADPGPLGVLPVPAGATPWIANTNTPMNLDAFVQQFYVKTGWTEEEGLYKQRGFTSAAIEGWINLDGSQQSINIVRFSTAKGALSLFDGTTNTWRGNPKPAEMLTDPAVDGVGWINPTLDSDGNARVEIAAQLGDTVIDVIEYTAATPDVAAAKSLILKQYESLKTARGI